MLIESSSTMCVTAARLTSRRTASRSLCSYALGRALALGSTIIAIATVPLHAQADERHAPRAAVYGRVTLLGDGRAIGSAVVRVVGQTLAAPTDSAGHFRIDGLAPGRVDLIASRLGLASATATVVLHSGDSTEVGFELALSPLRLSGVQVLAREGQTVDAGGTSSRIGRDAIDHVQASSLADILQLVPGQLAGNPTLAVAGQSLLRQIPVGSAAGVEAQRANALGTAVMVDGVPLSNNANLQTDVAILNSSPGALPPFSSTAGRGIDLRTIPADQIDSVEVVRGIPSVRYGDLTQGAILVTSRAGARAPELRVRANPQTLELSGSAGWGDGRVRRGVTVDGNLTTSQDDPRQLEGRYARATSQFAWTQPWLPGDALSTTLRATLYSSLDEQRRAPDDARYQRERFARDRGVRVSAASRWRADSLGATRVDATFSADVSEQTGSYQELIGREIFPLTRATTDTTVVGAFGASEYLNRTTVGGAPRNLYARLEGTARRTILGWRTAPIVGAEWRYDVNRGTGRQFDLAAPPRQNYSVGDRPRAYSDIPALMQVGLYAEERASGTILGRTATLQAGLRVDDFASSGFSSGRASTTVQPRVNASLALRDGLRARLGYGVTAKAPTLSQLYPGPRFFDLVSFSYYATNPAERLLVITTRRVEPLNADIRAVRTEKRELGLDWVLGGASGTITAFQEATKGAFGMTRFATVLPVVKYRADSFPVGRPPVLAPVPAAVDTFIGAYDAPRNTRNIQNRGIELTADFPEWRALRTALSISGGWIATCATDGGVDIDTDALFRGATQPKRLGVYSGGSGGAGERAVTSMRLIQRTPALGLVASLLAQTIWIQRDRPIARIELPIGYLDRTGAITALSPERAESPEFADLKRIISPLSLVEERRPPLWLFDLRLSKALPAQAQFSLFVNNAFADRPLYRSARSPAASPVYEQRNPPLFFGAELVMRLPGGPRG